MKIFLTGMLALFLAFICYTSGAQRLKLTEGNLSVLKDERYINTEFVYDNMSVGKLELEEEYVQTKTADYNKKEDGKGDNRAKNWVADRQSRFEPKFNELLEKSSEMTVMKNARYTLVFKTNFTEPGYNIGVMRKNAEMSGEAWIVETANKSNVIAKISVQEALGRTFGGYNFDTDDRISETYADAAKALGSFIRKQF